MSHKVTTSKIPAIALMQPSPAAARRRIKSALWLGPPVPIKVFVRTNARARLSQTSQAGPKRRGGRGDTVEKSRGGGGRSGFQVDAGGPECCLASPGEELFPLLQPGLRSIPSGQVFHPGVLQLRPRRPATDVWPNRRSSPPPSGALIR